MTTTNRASKLRVLGAGVRSYLPWTRHKPGTGGSTSARYCYAVWLRHLTAAARTGADLRLDRVVELGPGDSLGVSIAALLSGAAQCTSLDVVAHNDPGHDLRVFDELIALFRQRASIPDDREFPLMLPHASVTAFPRELISDRALEAALAPGRLDAIRAAIPRRDMASDLPLRYLCPWSEDVVPAGSIDYVISQGVLQDMDHEPGRDTLSRAFVSMVRWLRPGGIMSHQVDLSAPIGMAWNDHWAIGDTRWRLTRGRRPYYLNRVPLSEYLRLCGAHGFEVLAVTREPAPPGRTREEVAPAFRNLPDEDFHTSAVHLVARKRS
jgi:hypothetical protein